MEVLPSTSVTGIEIQCRGLWNYGSKRDFCRCFGKFWHGKNAFGVEITEVDAILAITSVNQEKNSERRRENYGSNGGFAGYFRNRQGNSMP